MRKVRVLERVDCKNCYGKKAGETVEVDNSLNCFYCGRNLIGIYVAEEVVEEKTLAEKICEFVRSKSVRDLVNYDEEIAKIAMLHAVEVVERIASQSRQSMSPLKENIIEALKQESELNKQN